jgi:hypothetical protein
MLLVTLVGVTATLVAPARDATAATVLKGNIDSLVGGDTVSGWACQVGSPTSVAVQVYAGNPATTKVLLVSGTASLASEPAIGGACNSTSGALRFQLVIPAAAKAQYAGYPVYVTAGAGSVISRSGAFQLPLTNGGAWSFDDASGTTAKGTFDNGTLVNSPLWTTGAECHAGTCLAFPNNKVTQAYVDVPYSSALRFGTGDFTLSAWIQMPAGTPDSNVIASTRTPDVNRGLLLKVDNGKVDFQALGTGANGGYIELKSTGLVNDGAWHLVAARRRGTSLLLDVDGALVATAAVSSTFDSDGTMSTMRIGGKLNAGGNFIGTLDDVQFLGRALTDSEIGTASADRPLNTGAPVVRGNIDAVVNGDTVAGWACQVRSPASQPVQVYAGDPFNGGVLLATGATSLASEPAVGALCSSTSSALRFQVAIPAALKSAYQHYPVHVLAGGAPLAQSGTFLLPATKGSSWSFDEGTGTIAHGTFADGTLEKGPTWLPADQCVAGTCLSFPNNKVTQASVSVPYASALKFGTGDFSVSARFKTTAGTGENVILGPNQCGVQQGWLVSVQDGKAAFGTWGTGGVGQYIKSEVRVDDGVWHLVVARRRGTSVSLSVDGGLAAAMPVASTYSSDASGSTLRIGNLSGCTGREFVGSIDDVHVVGRALTDAELGITKPANLSVINLRSLANNLFVSLNPSPYQPWILASSSGASEHEALLVTDLGNGVVTLRDNQQRALRVDSAVTKRLMESGSVVSVESYRFQWIDLGHHKVALRSLGTNQYLCAENVGTEPLVANRTAIGPWETFEWQPAPLFDGLKNAPQSIRITSAATSTYVSAVNGKPDNNLTTSTATGSLTKFRVMDEGSGRVSIKAMGTDFYVSALEPTTHTLIANAAEAGPWETFEWIFLGGPAVAGNKLFALRSTANQMFVSATSSGTLALNQSTSIGAAETFEWADQSEGVDALSAGGFSFLYDKNYGNKDVGVSVWITGAATNKANLDELLASISPNLDAGRTLRKLLPGSSSAASSTFAEVLGSTGAVATLFSKNVNVVEMSGNVKNDGVRHFIATALGYTVLDSDLLADGQWSVSRTFFEEKGDFMVGPVPITVTGGLSGSLSSTWTVLATAQGSLDATISPTIELDMSCSAGIGDGFVSVGVEGTLQMLGLTTPLTIGFNPSNRSYKASNSVVLSTMAGSIDLFAKASFGFGEWSVEKTYSKQIAGFGGGSLSASLFNQAGSL